MRKAFPAIVVLATSLAVPLLAQQDFMKSTIVSRLKNSRDFTLKVADAMPDSDYGFKLTKEQMSFAQQMAHIGESFSYFLATFTGQKPDEAKPASMGKADVMKFVKSSYDKAIGDVEKLSSAQLEKTYQTPEGKTDGLTTLIAMLEHAAHHRACAEMYLRAKGIKPPSYMD
jgi:uncharacterized damage-inducible protein DinB